MTIEIQHYGMYIPDIFKNFAKFFLLVTHCFLLSKSLSVCFLWCGLVSIHVYWFLCSLALALALWLSVLALCLPCPVCLPSGPCVTFWIYLGSGSLVPMVLSLLGCSCASGLCR